jgi:nucleoside-diphosphate-sugar epimerase
MKIFVTGGKGFIASYVIKELQSRGYNVVTNVRTKDEVTGVETYVMDTRDKAGMYSIIQKSDGVIHLAGLLGTSENMRQAELMNEVNVGGALNVLNALDQFKLPGSFIGVGNHFENNPYSISKTMAERYVLMYAKNFGTKVNVTRTYDAVGPGQKFGKVNKILPTFILKALRGEDISVYGGRDHCSTIDLIWVGDVARRLVEGLVSPDKGNVFEAGSAVPMKVIDIAEKVVQVCGSKSQIIEVPMRQGESECAHVVAQTSSSTRFFDDYLPETIEYYKQYV